MTIETGKNPQEEMEGSENPEKHRLDGERTAERWADEIKNTLESKRGEWVYEMDLENVAGSPYALSGWEYAGFLEGWKQGLKNKGIETRMGTEEERKEGGGGTWYRVV